MGDKHKKQDNPIEKLKEWQENQYNPGYYTGGKIPPHVEIPSKTGLFGNLYKYGAKIVGVLEILAGAAIIFMGVKIVTVQDYYEVGSLIGNLLGAIIVFGGLGILFILSGLKYIRKVKSKVKYKN